jgi:hypothetical protein
MFSKAIVAAAVVAATNASEAFDADAEKYSIESGLDFAPFAIQMMSGIPELDQFMKKISWASEALGLGAFNLDMFNENQHLVQAGNSITDYYKTTVLNVMDFGVKYYISWDW